MDNERAKIILSAYRPNGADAQDPLLREALEQARLDPELSQWLADQQRFDLQMSTAVRSIRPPDSLKAQILAAAQANKKSPSTRAGTRRRRLINPAWLALAATVVLSISGIFAFRMTAPQPVAFSAVTDRILQVRDELPGTLGALSPDPKELQRWLATHKGPNGFALPNGLVDKNSVGCQVFNVKGNKVSLICFQLDDKRIVHYFVMDRSSLTDPPPVGKPVVHHKDGASLICWSDERRSYVLAEFAPNRELKNLL